MSPHPSSDPSYPDGPRSVRPGRRRPEVPLADRLRAAVRARVDAVADVVAGAGRTPKPTLIPLPVDPGAGRARRGGGYR